MRCQMQDAAVGRFPLESGFARVVAYQNPDVLGGMRISDGPSRGLQPVGGTRERPTTSLRMGEFLRTVVTGGAPVGPWSRTGASFSGGGQAGRDPTRPRSAASRNPWNSSRNSPVRQKFSGCHCTPTQNVAPGRSIASMTPSGAVADTTNPGASAFTDW